MRLSEALSRGVRGTAFAKMTGSGNDFVFFDGRTAPTALLTVPETIRAICSRHNGIGADGIVVLEHEASTMQTPLKHAASMIETPIETPVVRIHYFNSDGSAADLCGNATLCSAAIAPVWQLADADAIRLRTPAGDIVARIRDGLPEIDLPEVTSIQDAISIALDPLETRIGFAIAGIPHLVALTTDAERVALGDRGPALRWHAATGAPGANVNWVSPTAGNAWRYRTFERGVEGETLACGTGAVATAILLQRWGLADGTVRIRTSSGRDLEVRFREPHHLGVQAQSVPACEPRGPTDGATSADQAAGTRWLPSLRGEGRVVFTGRIGAL